MTAATREVEEPLVESAPLAHQMAPTLCVPDPETSVRCDWYHGFWQYLRAMGLAPTLGEQGGFLRDTLCPLARSRSAGRVLVSGCADYSLPAHVLWAYRQERAPLDLAVVDRCETPLYLTRWYAERLGTALTTARHDVLDYESPDPFDVIVANSFLGYFEPAVWPRLYTVWARLLRPGGTLVFSNRIRPTAEPGLTGFTPGQARGFVDTVLGEAERWRAVFHFDLREIAERARVYAERFRSHPLRSSDDLASALDGAGFTVDRLEVVRAAGRTGSGSLGGPSVSSPANQLRVVATRR